MHDCTACDRACCGNALCRFATGDLGFAVAVDQDYGVLLATLVVWAWLLTAVAAAAEPCDRKAGSLRCLADWSGGIGKLR